MRRAAESGAELSIENECHIITDIGNGAHGACITVYLKAS